MRRGAGVGHRYTRLQSCNSLKLESAEPEFAAIELQRQKQRGFGLFRIVAFRGSTPMISRGFSSTINFWPTTDGSPPNLSRQIRS